MKDEFIFEKTNIAGIEINNRVFRAATDESLADQDGNVTKELTKVYEDLANGGIGLIITGYMAVSEDGKSPVQGMSMIESDDRIEPLKKMTDRIHELNTPIVAQLVHCGTNGVARKKFNVNKISKATIKRVENDFVNAIARARNAGFDGVELHCAHGYFLSQMLSPFTNKRKDEYGGTIENRYRIVDEIVKKAKKLMPDFPIFAKVNSDDDVKDGINTRLAVSISKRLEKSGIDAIEVSRALEFKSMGPLYGKVPVEMIEHDYPRIKNLPTEVKKTLKPMLSKMFKSKEPTRMYNVETAVKIKRAVHIPVIVVGGIHDLEEIRETLEDGIDFVSMSRPLIIEPDLINKYKNGTETKSKCIECNNCLIGIFQRPLRCYYGKLPNRKIIDVAEDNPSITKIREKCIFCGLCYDVCTSQVGLNRTKDNTVCINCGQCVIKCPVDSLQPKKEYDKILEILQNKKPNQKVAISIAPGVRVSIGDKFGIKDSKNMEKYLPAMLRKIGFDYVFDVAFGADVTIMEEASELVERLKNNVKREKKKNATSKNALPMFTSCCPSWVKYAEMYHPELIPNLSTCKSPIGMQSSLVKSYFKETNKIDDEIISVVVAPCTAKKYEKQFNDTDYVITTSELSDLIRELKIDINNVEASKFDSLLSTHSSRGLMFGRSGGVMESALNMAHYIITGETPKENIYHIEMTSPTYTATYKIGNFNVRIAVVYGMRNLEKLLTKKNKFDFIEVMNCYGGCINGGGQNVVREVKDQDLQANRTKSINETKNKILYCFQNPDIQALYNNYLDKPLSPKSEKLLHRKFVDRTNEVVK